MSSHPDIDAAVRSMIALSDELLALAAEENGLLARGLPGSLLGIVHRKTVLAAELEQWVGRVKSQQILLSDAEPSLTAALLERGRRLKAALAENSERLTTAMAATRRRVEAIMRAIREQNTVPAGYGPNGRTGYAAGTPAPFRSDFNV